MTAALTVLYHSLALGTLAGFPLYAWRARGRYYAAFVLAILALSLPGATVVHARLLERLSAPAATVLAAVFLYGLVAAATHLLALTRPQLRSAPFRFGVSLPGMTFVAAGGLSTLWLLAMLPVRLLLLAAGAHDLLERLLWLDLLPFAVAAASVPTSLGLRREHVRIDLPAPDVRSTAEARPASADATSGATSTPATEARVRRVPVERRAMRRSAAEARTVDRPVLRIAQITDPHIGPWQSVASLRRRIERLVAREPDLVLLTGDYLTMEGAGSPGALAEALHPLAPLTGRTFAIFGNHDHESPGEVRAALASAGVHLLMDAAAIVDTPIGPVEILGADYVFRGRREHLAELFARHPRHPGVPRILLLHDPAAFRLVPPGAADLTLSGHTHGGQLGLVTLGFDWTVLERTAWPDHGLFALGRNRLYVHRGTGFYGFPLRVGVPGEESILEVVPAATAP